MPRIPPPDLSLDQICAAFSLPPRAVQCFDPEHPVIEATRPLLVLGDDCDTVRPLLANRYPSLHPLRALVAGLVSASTLDAAPTDADAWLLDPLPVEADVRSLSGLRGIIDRLTGPGGCPWDREQTPETLRKYLLEETYEVVDAIDRGDRAGLREELGDVLMHVLMQASLARERGEFTIEDVVQASATKMVRRHPHVFGGEAFESTERLLDRWEQIKAEERATAGAGTRSPLDAVPQALPALQRAQALLARGHRLAPQLDPELTTKALHDALQAATRDLIDGSGDTMAAAVALGDVLFLIAVSARNAGLDAEEALRLRANAYAASVAAAADAGSLQPKRDPPAARRRAVRAPEPPASPAV